MFEGACFGLMLLCVATMFMSTSTYFFGMSSQIRNRRNWRLNWAAAALCLLFLVGLGVLDGGRLDLILTALGMCVVGIIASRMSWPPRRS